MCLNDLPVFAGIVEKKGKKGKRLEVDCENVRKCRHLQDACIYYRTLSIEINKHIPQPIIETTSCCVSHKYLDENAFFGCHTSSVEEKCRTEWEVKLETVNCI